MAIHTVETRWFVEGDLPGKVEDWFRDLGDTPASDWETRDDIYLVVPHSHDIGIKTRSITEAFEVKGRMRNLGEHRFKSGLSGTVDTWAKWSHDEFGSEHWITTLAERYPGAVRVRKSRLKRYYQITGPSDFSQMPSSGPMDRGGILEVAKLWRAGTQYWSVAMEAFPVDQDLPKDMQQVTTTLLEHFPVDLGPHLSMAYPEWLSAVSFR
jgi:hypothetical protein